ncbi:GGDEF domain-containing protein [Thiohalobacter sp.]|uniref:GGDEF domain-containing protein n=1 Tax=Thiohalobacter sp. TaxID=2025948 RepID=UPI00261B0826|nr:diguanylate cyclase [Thiohalobacter sp.]
MHRSLGYRERMILFVAAIGLLMVASLIASYYSARTVIWEDAALHRERTVRFHERNLEKLRIDLTHYAHTIRADLRIQDYLFATIRIGTTADPIAQLIQEQFSKLQVDEIAIADLDGRRIVGREGDPLLAAVDWTDTTRQPKVVGYENAGLPCMAAVLPVLYRDDLIAHAATARCLGRGWLESQPRDRSNELLVVNGGIVLASTSPALEGLAFNPSDNTIELGDQSYRLARVRLPLPGDSGAQLWLADSETSLVKTLGRYNRAMLSLIAVTILVMLFTGLVAVNNFSRPIQRLTELTREIAEGHLPRMQKSTGGTEIDKLVNQFVELTESLRRKEAEVRAAHEQLKRNAITDELTGTYNRRYLNEIFPRLLAQAEREGQQLSAILCDLDRFKQINDRLGHPAGDACLIAFADILRENIRSNDFIFRMGGEEFLILTVGHARDAALRLAEKVRRTTAATPVPFQDTNISMTVSCGVVCTRPSTSYQPTLSRLISIADQCLYRAKAAGRNRVEASELCDTGDTVAS